MGQPHQNPDNFAQGIKVHNTWMVFFIRQDSKKVIFLVALRGRGGGMSLRPPLVCGSPYQVTMRTQLKPHVSMRWYEMVILIDTDWRWKLTFFLVMVILIDTQFRGFLPTLCLGVPSINLIKHYFLFEQRKRESVSVWERESRWKGKKEKERY